MFISSRFRFHYIVSSFSIFGIDNLKVFQCFKSLLLFKKLRFEYTVYCAIILRVCWLRVFIPLNYMIFFHQLPAFFQVFTTMPSSVPSACVCFCFTGVHPISGYFLTASYFEGRPRKQGSWHASPGCRRICRYKIREEKQHPSTPMNLFRWAAIR